MSSQHADPAGLTVRPGAEVKAAASQVLGERGLEMRSFIVACLVALAADPDEFLAALRPHWPPTTPRGRPRGSRQTPEPGVGGNVLLTG